MIISYDDQDDDRFVEEIVEAAGPRALMAHGTQSTSARRQKLCKVNCFQVNCVQVILYESEQCPSYCFNVNSVQVLFIESEQCSSAFKNQAMVYKPLCSSACVGQGAKS